MVIIDHHIDAGIEMKPFSIVAECMVGTIRARDTQKHVIGSYAWQSLKLEATDKR
jgi:hypothetical protein